MGEIKKLILLIIFVLIILSSSIIIMAEKPEDVKLAYFVNDYAGILTQEQEDKIANELIPLYNSNIAQISVLIINSTDGQDITSFAYQVAEGKLGDKEKNNGLLILIAVDDKKYRFEVGRGLEPYLNDAKIGRIGREYIVPNFKKEDYYTGIYESTLSIQSILENNVESSYYPKRQGLTINHYLIILIFLITILLVITEAKNTKSTHNFNNTTKKNNKNNEDIFLAAGALATILRGGKGGNGGFGGFGGGGFGGGGAGGNW